MDKSHILPERPQVKPRPKAEISPYWKPEKNYVNRYGKPPGETGSKKESEASLVCGTCGEWLWLLRSRPDQVDQATMRRGPPLRILSVFIVQKPRCALNKICNAWFQKPNCVHKASTRALTCASIVMVRPHSRFVSPGHLLVASIPILLPRPLTGEAKSK